MAPPRHRCGRPRRLILHNNSGWRLLSPDGKTARDLGIKASVCTLSRDAADLYCVRSDGSGATLVSRRVTGGPERVVTRLAANQVPDSRLNPSLKLTWTPDGRHLTFSAARRGSSLWLPKHRHYDEKQEIWFCVYQFRVSTAASGAGRLGFTVACDVGRDDVYGSRMYDAAGRRRQRRSGSAVRRPRVVDFVNREAFDLRTCFRRCWTHAASDGPAFKLSSFIADAASARPLMACTPMCDATPATGRSGVIYDRRVYRRQRRDALVPGSHLRSWGPKSDADGAPMASVRFRLAAGPVR